MIESGHTPLRRAAAIILVVLLVFAAGCKKQPPAGEEPQPVEVNRVSSYAPEAADYLLYADAAVEGHGISDLLFGVFFEDINFAADGGLYAEMVSNRSFEFTELAAGDGLYRWTSVEYAKAEVGSDPEISLNVNNPHYLVLENGGRNKAGVSNSGFLDGMSVVEDADYRFSVYLRGLDGYEGEAYVRLCAGAAVAAVGTLNGIGPEWKKHSLTLTSAFTSHENVTLELLIPHGKVAADMVSLFPADTYKGRENGLRKDLCERLEALHPKFLRFPGGCVIEGVDENTAYSWKASVGTGPDGRPLEFEGRFGDVAARKQGVNLWTDLGATEDPYPSFMSYGLGFFEFFQLCEDLGASPVPVLNAALYCQMRGQHGEEDEEKYRQYVQDLLDLVEFARGSAASEWGKVRASLGHPEPFELKYVAIGNENERREYYDRYSDFLAAFKEAKENDPALFDGVELIYSAGPSDAFGSDQYLKAYEYAKAQLGESENALDFAGAIDQHYYQSPEWLLQHADYYDENHYSRTVSGMTDSVYGGAIPVFLGEYAGRSNTLRAALAEAAYMTGLERNGDIVRMACYAPLFASGAARHWAPDLIWFNNHTTCASVNYHAQSLFSNNTGSVLVPSTLEGAAVPQPELTGGVGVGTWYTAAVFDDVTVVDNDTGETLLKDAFSFPSFSLRWDNPNKGDFKIKKGALAHVGTGMNYADIGDAAYLGAGKDLKNYTYTVRATKTDGDEGFLIPFAVQDKDNNWFWNLGGWGNTVSCLQRMENGVKTGQILPTVTEFSVETGHTYELKVVVSGTRVCCYADGEKLIDFDTGHPAEAEAYQVVSRDGNGDLIVKLVNVTERPGVFALSLKNAALRGEALVSQLAGKSNEDENRLDEEETCTVREFTLSVDADAFNLSVPALSVTVLRFPAASAEAPGGEE